MGEELCFLITLLASDNMLIRVALKVNEKDFPEECREGPTLYEDKTVLWNMLPLHCQTIGPIVQVEDLFEITVKQENER
jgi:hypothetical protein